MIKVDKDKDKVIVQSGSDEDTATIATSETTESSEGKSSQRGNGEKGLREEQIIEPRPNTRRMSSDEGGIQSAG